MSESPDTEYRAEAWRMTDYYPDSYAKSMSALVIGIYYDDDDWERYRAEFMADLAAHDREVAAKALEDAAKDFDGIYNVKPYPGDRLRARAAHIREGEQ